MRRIAPLVLFGSLLAVVSCGRSGTHALKGANDQQVSRGWEVGCDAFCGVEARAKDLDSLCDEIAGEGPEGPSQFTCEARAPLGLSSSAPGAVGDLAILDVTPNGSTKRTAILAMQTSLGWIAARPIGTVDDAKGEHIGVIDASPVDVAGLEAESYRVRVAIGKKGIVEERYFVCGVQGDAKVACPLAARVAAHPENEASGGAVLAAGIVDTFSPSVASWRIDVALTADGFVAKQEQGDVPPQVASLLGEHTWSNSASWK